MGWRVHHRTSEGLTDDEVEIARASIKQNLDAQDGHEAFDAAVAEAREKLAGTDGPHDVELADTGASVAPYEAPAVEEPEPGPVE